MADDKKAPAPINVVLYMRSDPKGDWTPVFSGDNQDSGVMDEVASHKHERLIAARQAGAPRPEFKVTRESLGQEVKG